MKVKKITLKDMRFVETDEDFEVIYENEKTYPLFLTHAALKRGHDLGIIEGSLVEDLLRVSATSSENANGLDDSRMTAIIYLGFVGANPKSDLSYEDFLEKLHYTTYELFEMYADLISDIVTNEKNEFAAGLIKSTEKSEKK